MGLGAALKDVLQPIFKVGRGIRGAVTDTESLVGDVLDRDAHGVITNARKVASDATDVIEGLVGLGVNVYNLPQNVVKGWKWVTDSEVLTVAQLAIEAELKLLGSGEPEDGSGTYGDSSKRLEKAVKTLIEASPAKDRWDGSASNAYEGLNDAHRRLTSGVQVADGEVAKHLSTEAGQVSRTRTALEDSAQYLYDYGLTTAWLNKVPGGKRAKAILDAVAAGIALTNVNGHLVVLTKNVLENASRINALAKDYTDAAKDTSDTEWKAGEGKYAPGAPFVPQTEDIDAKHATGIPNSEGRTGRPSRLDPSIPFTVPDGDGVNYPPAMPLPQTAPTPAAEPGSSTVPTSTAPNTPSFTPSPTPATTPASPVSPTTGVAPASVNQRFAQGPSVSSAPAPVAPSTAAAATTVPAAAKTPVAAGVEGASPGAAGLSRAPVAAVTETLAEEIPTTTAPAGVQAQT